MVLPIAIALMAAAGHRKYKQDQLDEQDAAEATQARREDRALMVGERARVARQRDDTAAAAAPTTVEDAPVAMPIGSRDEPRAPEDVGVRAAGQSFTSRADADKAAAAYNAEPAVAKRVANVARMNGDYAGSQQVMNLSRQGQLADMQLDEAQTTHLNKMFDDNLQRLGTHDDIAKAISESALGGDMKLKPVASADGKKVEYQRVNPDGSTTPTGYSFSADSRGILEAKQVMSRMTPVGQKLEYLHRQASDERDQGNKDADRAIRSKEVDRKATHDEGMLGLRKQELALQARRDAVAASMAADAIKRANTPAPGQAATAESTFDTKTAADIAKERVNVEAKADLDAGKPAWSAQQIAQRKDAIVQALYQQHTSRFIESAVTRALAGAQGDPAAYAVAFDQAQKTGVPLKRLGELGFKPPQRAAAPAAPGAQPAAQPAAAQPAAAPAGAMPAVPFQQFVAQNITSPAGKQAISQRVMKELPEIQTRIKGITDVMALPMVSGAVKAKLKGELDMLAQDAEMMQAFAAGNPGV
jgi:hypothetical protein